MGLFNYLYAKVDCPICGHNAEREIQFKYGQLRLYKYALGDHLKPDEGITFPNNIRVKGITDCDVCETHYLVCEIHVGNGTIKRIEMLPSILNDSSPRKGKSAKNTKKRKRK
jgi:hypothetical protein